MNYSNQLKMWTFDQKEYNYRKANPLWNSITLLSAILVIGKTIELYHTSRIA